VVSSNPYSQFYAQRQNALRNILLFMMLQQAAQQQGQGQGNQQSTIKKLLGNVGKARDLYNTGESAYGLFSSGASGAESLNQVIPLYTNSGMAANEAANATWNAGAEASRGAEAASGGNGYAGYLAAALSLLNDSKKLIGSNLTDEQKTTEAGRVIPRAVAAYFTGGLSLAGEGLARKQWGGTAQKLDSLHSKIHPLSVASRLWTSDKWKDEGNRLKKLEEQGIDVAPEHEGRMYQQRGMKFEQLLNPNVARDFKGYDPRYGWVNNKWTLSRNEADLAPEDIVGTATMYEKFGKDWMGKYNTKQRLAIAKTILDNKAMDEAKGTWNVKWTPELEKAAMDAATMIPTANSSQAMKPQRYTLRNGELVQTNPQEYQRKLAAYSQSQQSGGPGDNEILWAPDTIYYRPELNQQSTPSMQIPRASAPVQQSRPSRYVLRNGELVLRG
jgi:hypothetical protein